VLTPYRGETIPSLAFGQVPRWFDVNGYRLATAICFEDTVPQVTRRFFAEAPDGRKPDLLLNLSNDGWFKWSEELEMHLAVSVFRAVENRVPLARAVNTGISALIDGNGHIQARLPKNTQQVLVGVAMLDDRVALYTFWGDWLGQACLALTSIALLIAIASALVSGGRKRAH
jgi:apolipoprotein N-acyltransferase